MIISLRNNLLLDSSYTLSNKHLLLLMSCRYLAEKKAAIIHITVHYYIQPAVPSAPLFGSLGSAHAPVAKSRDESGFLPDSYLHIVNKNKR